MVSRLFVTNLWLDSRHLAARCSSPWLARRSTLCLPGRSLRAGGTACSFLSVLVTRSLHACASRLLLSVLTWTSWHHSAAWCALSTFSPSLLSCSFAFFLEPDSSSLLALQSTWWLPDTTLLLDSCSEEFCIGLPSRKLFHVAIFRKIAHC